MGRRIRGRWPGGVVIALVALSLLVAIQYFAGAAGSNLNPNDDQILYLAFPPKILASGSLLEPFSLRRMAGYGGQSFLQALTLLRSVTPTQVTLMDFGISLVMVLALIAGAADDRTPRELWVLPMLFVLTLPNLHNNTASEVSGVVFFLALFRTVTWSAGQERPIATSVVVGMVAAATCTLRHSYLVPVVVFMALLYLPAKLPSKLPTMIADLRARHAAARPRLVGGAVAAAALLLFILPWALLSYRSNRTLLFPVFDGNYRREFLLVGGDVSLPDRLRAFWANLGNGSPVRTLPLLILAGLAIPSRRSHGALPSLLWALFAGFTMTVRGLPLLDAAHIARYYYAFDVGTVLAVMLSALALPWQPATGAERARATIPAVLVALAVAVQLQSAGAAVYADYLTMGERIITVASNPAALPSENESYRKLQASIPAGAPIFAMLDEPFWLDFRRNRIDLVDLPGAVSPERSLPLDEDEALVRYLAERGYRYVAFVRSTQSLALYRRDTMNNLLRSSNPIAKATVPFYLRMFNRWDSLMKSRLKLYDDGRMVALDLGSRTKH